MRIFGSTILVTGATGGVGRTLARQLKAVGADLILSAKRADALADLCDELGARPEVADLAVPADVDRLAESCLGIDGLIANAALPASGDLLEYSSEQVQRALAVNLVAPIGLARLLAPPMVKAHRGHIVFVGSLSGVAATPLSSLYTATKFGLRGFALALRQDLGSAGVGVSIIQPGFVGDAGMFATTGEPTPTGVATVSPEQVGTAIIRAIEENRGQVSVAPPSLRLRCWIAGQFPALAERLPARSSAGEIAQRIVDAQRSAR